MSLKNFKAAILTKSKSLLTVDEIEANTTLLEGQVLVKIIFSGICGKQIEEIDAHFGPDKYLPHLLGHEGSGIVIAKSKTVNKVTEGDSVVIHWMNGSGRTGLFGDYKWKGVKLNSGQITTFNQYAIIGESKITKIPSNANLQNAALLGCGISTGFGAVFNESKPKINDSIVVWGCGGVGLSVIKACRILGVKDIIAIDRSKEALVRAKNIGASTTIEYADENWSNIKLTLMNKFNVSFICTGDQNAIPICHELMNENSSTFVVGVPPVNSYIKLDALMLHKRKMITGSFGGSISPDTDIQNYLQIIDDRDFPMQYFKGPTVALDNINQGIDLTRKGGNGRVLIDLFA